MLTKLITPLERIATSCYCYQINHAPVPGRGFLRLKSDFSTAIPAND
jgi:hypothetical protein